MTKGPNQIAEEVKQSDTGQDEVWFQTLCLGPQKILILHNWDLSNNPVDMTYIQGVPTSFVWRVYPYIKRIKPKIREIRTLKYLSIFSSKWTDILLSQNVN